MGLAHHRREVAPPRLVELAEAAQAVAVRMCAPVLLPEQPKRHAGALQLGVDQGPVGLRAVRRTASLAREQHAFKLGVAQPRRERPLEPRYARPAQVLAPSSAPDRAPGRSAARSCRRRASSAERRAPGASAVSWLAWRPPHRSTRGRPYRRLQIASGRSRRTRWPASSDSVAGLNRNQRPLCLGMRTYVPLYSTGLRTLRLRPRLRDWMYRKSVSIVDASAVARPGAGSV
jgi:hypothetical protein